MAFDRTRDEWHLTPEGWVQGTSYYFGKPQREVAPPRNRIETWKRDQEQASSYARHEDISWSRVWKSKKFTEAKCDKIRAKFLDQLVDWFPEFSGDSPFSKVRPSSDFAKLLGEEPED